MVQVKVARVVLEQAVQAQKVPVTGILEPEMPQVWSHALVGRQALKVQACHRQA